jgi:K(+)-stimulated pyrophosphate-energized sodium pump
MFARVGGGVFTKAADVGSDLVGKVEQGIPEDDPRNPAVMADNVGDNVGDVAGMGADLVESFVGAIIATAALAPRLAAQFADTNLGAADYQADFNAIMHAGIALPFWINGGGILASLIGIAAIRNTTLPDGTTLEALLTTITNGVLIASAVTTVFTAGIVWALFKSAVAWKLFGATVIGLIAGVVIGKFTEYCTAYEFTPTREIAEASAYGPAPVIIKGMGVGLLSVSVPMISTVVTILACNVIAGQYAVAIAAVGLLSTLGITLATDAYRGIDGFAPAGAVETRADGSQMGGWLSLTPPRRVAGPEAWAPAPAPVVVPWCASAATVEAALQAAARATLGAAIVWRAA